VDPLNFAYTVLKAIQERIVLTEQALLGGTPKNMEEYRQLTGEIKGLQFAEREVKDALDRNEKAESN
jgi:predicted  nucleic acid-binding Zn-ribbon protein|tara:strand:- start:1476 stop:1676 length:201 start_codon:yes stop_codon:yes gene_type:complete